jgi:hypothetical protein
MFNLNTKVKDNVIITTYDVLQIAADYNLSPQEVERQLAAGVVFEPLVKQSAHNLITSVGLTMFVDRLIYPDTTLSTLTYFAVGTGTTAPTQADTALQAEVYRDQITSRSDVSTGLDTVMCYIPTAYPASQPVNLGEAGLFNASLNGILFAHVLISPVVNKTNSISMTLSWNIQAQ